MGVSLDGKLVVAISSRALFDFEEENQVFEQADDRAYMKLQLDRLEIPAKPGVAFSLVKKLLAFNQAGAQHIEVVILSRNDPVSGMRVFRSAQHYGLPIQRGSFTRGQAPWRYLKPLHANLFLSTHLSDVRAALDAGVPAAQVYPHSAHASDAHPNEVRIAFDGDAVLFSDEAEQVYQAQGLNAFQQHEKDKASQPLSAGPFKPLLEALHRLQTQGTPSMRIRTALVTARSVASSMPLAAHSSAQRAAAVRDVAHEILEGGHRELARIVDVDAVAAAAGEGVLVGEELLHVGPARHHPRHPRVQVLGRWHLHRRRDGDRHGVPDAGLLAAWNASAVAP